MKNPKKLIFETELTRLVRSQLLIDEMFELGLLNDEIFALVKQSFHARNRTSTAAESSRLAKQYPTQKEE